MNRTEHAFNNIVFGILFRIIDLIGPFIIRTIIIRTIGIEYLGISGLFSSILMMLNFSEMGLSSAIAYKCYSLYSRCEYEQMNNLLGYYKKVYIKIGVFILSVGLVILPFLKIFVHGDLPSKINIYIVFFIYLLQTVISYFISAYRGVILTVSQRKDLESKISISCCCLLYFVQIILLIIFKNYYVYILVIPIIAVINNLLRIYITKHHFPNIYANGDISKSDKREIIKSIFPLIGHRLEGTVICSADNIVISMFLGVSMVAVYANYYTIISALSGFVVVIYAAIQPGIGNSVITESKEKNFLDLKIFSFFFIWLVGWMSICLICLFQDFISLAYGKKYLLEFSTIILLTVQFYIWRTFDIIMTYRDVIGKWNGDTIMPYISGSLNLLLNIILVQMIGINGVAISTILTIAFISLPFSIKVLFNELFFGYCKNFLHSYFLDTFYVLLCAVITYLICSTVFFESLLLQIIIKAAICLILPNAFFLAVFFKRKEFSVVTGRLLTFFRSIRRKN